ncbi:MAG TPA: methyltransferase [Casimicrobiaceae bacterium]|nr:methyltransferase [Casimicrobiaceae bacterium]
MTNATCRTARLVACIVAVAATACTTSLPRDDRADAAHYAAVIASPIRTDRDRQMDAERRPAEFLPFTQVKPGMRVLDVSAGAGYTSQLLALAVLPSGMLYAQTPRPGETLLKRLADHPQPNVVVVKRPFDDPIPEGTPPLDLITLVLNYHDITYQPVDRKAMNAKLFAALKPGGHFVVIDHSSRAGKGISEGRTLHRIDEAVVVDEVRQAGFVLEAEGAFLRNPADTRDTPSGAPKVPTDKFALRFVKPG